MVTKLVPRLSLCLAMTQDTATSSLFPLPSSRFTLHASRFTYYIPDIIFCMKTPQIEDTQNNEFCWVKTYPIKYYEMDFNMVLKPSALLNILQDIATINAEMHGFGYSFTYPKNYGWFLIKYHMEFDDYPHDLDDLVIKTEPRGISKIMAYRDFVIWTTDNTRLGRVVSSWMMINLNTKSILPLAKIIDSMPAFEKRENDLQYEKIQPTSHNDVEKTFEIRFDDIDVNQHVNNANYIIWAFETLPYEFKATHRLKTLDIVYKKEIAYGQNIISKLELDEENKTSTHILKNATTQDELCLIKAVWS